MNEYTEQVAVGKFNSAEEAAEFCRNYRFEEDDYIDAIKQERDKEIMQALGFNRMNIPLIDYLKRTQEQAIAWGLLDEVIDHSVNLHVAANKLRREIEKARGIE